MMTTILTTKLYAPPVTTQIQRDDMLARLDAGVRGKLTLVSAPAGFGKTSLVSAWAEASERPTAWLSLDSADGDPVRFLAYCIAAVQTIVPSFGDSIYQALQSPSPPPTATLLPPLTNALAALGTPLTLVLDDYHLVADEDIDGILQFLLDHHPPPLHLVIITRTDPDLALGRLRARGQLTEVRAADLRFSRDEAAAFLADVMGLSLDSDVVAQVIARTEGWAAGLQLAALAIGQHDNADDFLTSFTGSHQYVLDYLIEEVLRHQPPDVQGFLLQTALLDRFCAPLCDAVCEGLPPSDEMLRTLARGNLFLVPLDSAGRWYRYHHLFGDLLRERMRATQNSETLAAAHKKASDWYAANGYALEAFQHASAINDIERVLAVVQNGESPLYLQGDAPPVIAWLDTLPAATLTANPSLLVMQAITLTVTGKRIETLPSKLQAAEDALRDSEPDNPTRDLLGQIATMRALLAVPVYQLEMMQAESSRALDLLAPHNIAVRTLATWANGLAHQHLGHHDTARQCYIDTVSISERTGNLMMTVGALTCLGQIYEATNQLYQAAEAYEDVLARIGEPYWPATCEAHLGLARVAYQWDDLDRAEHHAQLGLTLGEQLENVDTPAACAVVLARIAHARGDLDRAADQLTVASGIAKQRHATLQMAHIAAEQVRLHIKRGQLTAAAQRLHDHDDAISRARLHIRRSEPAEARAALQSHTAETASVQLQHDILMAAIHAQHGDDERTNAALMRALTAAAPHDIVRVFVDEGEAVAGLVMGIDEGLMPQFIARLRAAFQTEQAANQPLVEPLSARELEILRLVAEGLSNRDISEQLFLALDTVKGHNRRIYAKLGVKRRTEAVARARDLGLV